MLILNYKFGAAEFVNEEDTIKVSQETDWHNTSVGNTILIRLQILVFQLAGVYNCTTHITR